MMRVKTGDGIETRKVLLEGGAATVDFGAPVEWVVANDRGAGFFRARYTPELLSSLTASVQDTLSAVERFNLVSDTWASVLAGLTPVSDFLALSRLFSTETDRNVWLAVLGGLEFIHRMLPAADRPKLQALLRELVGPSVGGSAGSAQDGEADLTAQLRGTLIATLGTTGEDSAIQARPASCTPRTSRTAQRWTATWCRPSSPSRPTLVTRPPMSCSGSGTSRLRRRRRRHATCSTWRRSQDRALLQRTLDATLTSEIRTQNAPFLIGSAMGHLEDGDLAWEFVKAHWDEMVARYPDNTHVRMLAGITALSTPERAAEIEEFFSVPRVRQGQKTLDQHLERLRINLAFRQRESSKLASYF